MSEEKQAMNPAEMPAASSEILLEWLRPVQDPELFMGLVDLGLIYEVTFQDAKAFVKMSLTSPGCPAAGYLVDQVRQRLLEYPGVKEADVMIVFEPKWDPRTMASDEVKDKLGIW